MNLCKDCKHFRGGRLHDVCTSPANPVDPVLGHTTATCRFARSSLYGTCGPAGNLFEEAPPPPPPKPALWQRIKAFLVRVWPW